MPIYTRLIKIGPTLYLTDNGTSGGDPVLTDIPGLEVLEDAWIGPVRIPFTGKPWEFVQQNEGLGFLLKIEAKRFPIDMLTSIRAINDDSKENDTDIAISISGGPETLSLNARSGGEGVRPIERGSQYSTGKNVFVDVTFNYTVSGFGA